jgi:hypothetical protein
MVGKMKMNEKKSKGLLQLQVQMILLKLPKEQNINSRTFFNVHWLAGGGRGGGHISYFKKMFGELLLFER